MFLPLIFLSSEFEKENYLKGIIVSMGGDGSILLIIPFVQEHKIQIHSDFGVLE
jgi:hypothetical protein